MSQNHREKPHTAHFLVSRFLNSRESLEFELSAHDKYTLRYLSDLMDMTAYSSSVRQCKISLDQAAMFTSMGRRTIQRSISTLLKLDLLSDISRGHGIKGIYILGVYFETCATQAHNESVDNSEMRHTGASDAPHRREDAPHRRTSNKAFKNSYKKEQGDASGSSPPPVDNFFDRQSFQFTPGEMTEAIQRDIHIQPCFDKFYDRLVNKGRQKFKRKEWETWFIRETNGKNAKLGRSSEIVAIVEESEAVEKKTLSEHYERGMAEHEERKKFDVSGIGKRTMSEIFAKLGVRPKINGSINQ